MRADGWRCDRGQCVGQHGLDLALQVRQLGKCFVLASFEFEHAGKRIGHGSHRRAAYSQWEAGCQTKPSARGVTKIQPEFAAAAWVKRGKFCGLANRRAAEGAETMW